MSNIKDAAGAVEGIAKAVPVYQDLLQPAMKELGKGIHTLSKTVHIALAPVSTLIWGYDHIKEYIQTSLEKKLKDVPKENIIPPDVTVAGPTLEALRYAGHKKELREMFTNLLATSMVSTSTTKAHPSFVEVIKQLTSDEAKIVKLLLDDKSKPIIKVRAYNKKNDHYAEPIEEFSILPEISGCAHPELGPSYLINIARLGIASISYSNYNTFPNAYTPLFNHPYILEQKQLIEKLDKRVELMRGTITRTQFGKMFYDACVL